MALVVVGVGTAIELHTVRGLSPVFAGLLATILATFSMTNYATTKQHMNTKASGGGDAVHSKLDEILAMAQGANDSQAAQVLVQTMQNMANSLGEVHTLTKQTGQAVVNMAKRGQI